MTVRGMTDISVNTFEMLKHMPNIHLIKAVDKSMNWDLLKTIDWIKPNGNKTSVFCYNLCHSFPVSWLFGEMSFDKLIFDKLISEDLFLSANSPRGVDPLWIPGPENPPNSDSLINFKMAF